MLQEILSQMYVDPELLEQLSDEFKEVLFRKMREEQVRRWKEKEKELEKRPPKKTARKINFSMGADGSPWVWVMGEHKDDLSLNELMRRREQEEMEKERQRELQDRKEAAELAKQERMGVQSLTTVLGAIGKFRRPLRRGSGLDVTDGPSEQSKQQLPSNSHLSVVRTESQMGTYGSPMPDRRGGSKEEDEEERERTLTKKATIIGLTDEEQSRFEKERTEEVFMSLQRARSISKKRAAHVAQNVEKMWQESQKKANEFERVRKTSFKKAQELTAKSPDIPDKILESIPVDKQKEIIRRMTLERKPRRQAPGPPRGRPDRPFRKQSSFVRPGTVPKSSSHVISWFNKNEAPKGIGRERDGSISIWFHGKLSRDGAAKLLEWKPVGSFVVRLSSKIWGYVVSVKTYTACKHFLVDASSSQYCFLGPKQQKFHTLTDLIKFYKENPVTWSGQEVLLIPVGQEEENVELYRGLYDDEGLSLEILGELEGIEYQGSTL